MESQKLEIGKNNEISYFEMISKQSDVGIIIIHGLAEHKGRYIELIEKLHALKFSVFALDLIGHGEDLHKKGDINNFIEFIDQLDQFVSNIKKRYPSMKIGLFGHSLGGLIAGCYAATYQNLDFLILSNPLLERRKIFNIFYCLPYKALGFIKFKKRRSESKAMLDYSRKDPLSCKRLTLRLAGEILITGINYLFKRLQQIKTPLLVLVGSEDPLIKTQDYPKLIQSFGSQDKTLKIYQGIKHRLVQSPQKEEVINDISNWVNKKIK